MSSPPKARTRSFAILEGILPIDGRGIPVDIVAGVTLAALAIPEVLGYANIAGMPVVTGLYTMLIPMALFAVFGSSRHLVVGADSATAAMMAAGLAGLAAAGSPEYVALAGMLAILTGGFVLFARLARLGFLADFLSRTVLIGFLTGVGIQVAIGQISGMLGLPGGGDTTLQKLVTDLRQLPETSLPTLALSLGTILITLGMKRITRKIPGALIAVVASILLSWALDFQAKGIAVLGAIPGGLPALGLPHAPWSALPQLLPTASAMFIVILAQSAATSRAYAAKYDERFSENTDLVGLTLANIGAGLSGAFVVNGSPTKTQMVDGAGGRSQVAHLTTVGIVFLVLAFLTKPLEYLPAAVLAAVVFLIGLELVDLRGMQSILAERQWEFWVAVITAAWWRERAIFDRPRWRRQPTRRPAWFSIASTTACTTPTRNCWRTRSWAFSGPSPVPSPGSVSTWSPSTTSTSRRRPPCARCAPKPGRKGLTLCLRTRATACARSSIVPGSSRWWARMPSSTISPT
jgi:SulP family sulfate permease